MYLCIYYHLILFSFHLQLFSYIFKKTNIHTVSTGFGFSTKTPFKVGTLDWFEQLTGRTRNINEIKEKIARLEGELEEAMVSLFVSFIIYVLAKLLSAITAFIFVTVRTGTRTFFCENVSFLLFTLYLKPIF